MCARRVEVLCDDCEGSVDGYVVRRMSCEPGWLMIHVATQTQGRILELSRGGLDTDPFSSVVHDAET